jgi:hypothetical protein
MPVIVLCFPCAFFSLLLLFIELRFINIIIDNV